MAEIPYFRHDTGACHSWQQCIAPRLNLNDRRLLHSNVPWVVFYFSLTFHVVYDNVFMCMAGIPSVSQVPCVPSLGCLAFLQVLYVSSMACLEKRMTTCVLCTGYIVKSSSLCFSAIRITKSTGRTKIYHIFNHTFRPKRPSSSWTQE